MLSDRPMLSILLAAYNAEYYIRNAIDSILNQSFEDFELIIADDGSLDNTKKIIDSYRDYRIVTNHNSTNLGKTSTINRLANLANGEYVTIHDADDYSYKERFHNQIEFLRENPSLVFCGTNFIVISERGKELTKSNLLLQNDELKEGLWHNSQFHGPTLVFRKSILEKLGNVYRPFFKDYNEDYDFCFRASEFGEVANIPDYLYYYRISRDSLSRKLTPQKRVSARLVQLLAEQRIKEGKPDFLMQGKDSELEELLMQWTKAYEEDKSLILREQAELDFYNGFKKKAIAESINAIKSNPRNFNNYRLLQHILRKIFLGI